MTKNSAGFHTSTLEEEGLTFVSIDRDDLIVENDKGERELYVQNDNAACWTLTYNGHQYEFARSIYTAKLTA